MPEPCPSLPLPPPLTALEPGTWAESTVKVRLGEIANRVIAENQFPPDVEERYRTLIAEIKEGTIRFLDEPLAPDKESWRSYVKLYLGQTWLEVPWFFAETYFYRRVLEASGYYQPGPMAGYDPFMVQKRFGVAASKNAILGLRAKVDQIQINGDRPADLRFLLQADLWGNRADLSLWPEDQDGESGDMTQSESFLLADESDEVIKILLNSDTTSRRVDIVADNAGFEFMVDLILGDYLLASGLADEIHYHLKAHPTFVSDATLNDLHETRKFFKDSHASPLQAMEARLSQAHAQSRLLIHADPFWTSPLPAWEMPAGVRAHLSQASIVFVKGDANYRRLLGDLQWPFDTPFSKILNYFPAPVCALRTLKAEIATGLDPEKVHKLNGEDPAWMTNGRWGLVQIGAT